jgi:hypothetical protein
MQSFNNYQSLERLPDGDNAPNRYIPDRVEQYGLMNYIDESSTVLDIGCNRGYFGVVLGPHVKAYQGVEHSNEVDHGVREVTERGIDNVTFAQCAFEDFNAFHSRYDLILLLAVVAYIDWDAGLLAQWLEDHVQPEGVVVIEGHPKGYLGEPENKLYPLIEELTRRMGLVEKTKIKDRTNTRELYTFMAPFAIGMVSRVWMQGDEVIKEYRPAEERYGCEVDNHWTNEVRCLKELHGVDGTPDLIDVRLSERAITMTYVGEPLTCENLPEDWYRQVVNLEARLAEKGIYHADARPKNICVKDGRINYVDFGIVHFDEPRKGWKSGTTYIEEWLNA